MIPKEFDTLFYFQTATDMIEQCKIKTFFSVCFKFQFKKMKKKLLMYKTIFFGKTADICCFTKK